MKYLSASIVWASSIYGATHFPAWQSQVAVMIVGFIIIFGMLGARDKAQG